MIMLLLISGIYFLTVTASYNIPEHKNIIIAGDSQIARAIDDDIFLHSVNISQPGTAYLYSYVKLKKFLDKNNHVDKVILSFHGYTIKKSRDEWITDSKYTLSYAPDYFPLFSREEIAFIVNNSKNKSSLFSAIAKSPVKSALTIIKMISGRKQTYKELNIGGYTKLEGEHLAQDIEIREIDETENEYSQCQHYYLLKIKELCREKNVELILLSTPSYDSSQYGNKLTLLNYYNDYFSGYKYLDFYDFEIPEYGYYDIFHINYKGAQIFSRYLEDNYDILFK